MTLCKRHDRDVMLTFLVYRVTALHRPTATSESLYLDALDEGDAVSWD